MTFLLHRCVLPDGALCADTQLYFRLTGNALYSFSDRSISLGGGDTVRFNTYFGAFSLRKWRRYTNLASLDLSIGINGAGLVRIWGAGFGIAPGLILEQFLEGGGEAQRLAMSRQLTMLQYESVYVEFVATKASTVDYLAFTTEQVPNKQVGLAIVITTYNRFDQICATAKRLAAFLDEFNNEGNDVKAFIVNNGDAIDVAESEYLTVLDNPNLGGAGGFARGLQSARSLPDCSHCLFMDDDAACEITSLERAYAFMSYSDNDSLSLAGTMLRNDLKTIQHEAGAVFDGLVRPLKSDWNLRRYSTVIANDRHVHVDYGAWWFFLFPLGRVNSLPFPFFVRGDDIEFSLSNDFDITTLNGVATWQDDFGTKLGPMVTYLSTRSTLVSSLLHGGWHRVVLWFAACAMKSAFGFCYDRTMAQCLAAEDVLAGPDFWSNNVDLKERRAFIAQATRYERPVDNDAEHYLDDFDFTQPDRLWSRIGRLLTLNGHLLPNFMLKRRSTVSCEYSSSPFARVAFRRRQVLYKTEGKPVFLAKLDRRYFASVAFRAFGLWLRLIFNSAALKKSYTQAHGRLTSEEFWMRQFSYTTEQEAK